MRPLAESRDWPARSGDGLVTKKERGVWLRKFFLKEIPRRFAIAYFSIFAVGLLISWITSWQSFVQAFGASYLMHPAFVISLLGMNFSSAIFGIAIALQTAFVSAGQKDTYRNLYRLRTFPDFARATKSMLSFGWKPRVAMPECSLNIPWSWIEAVDMRTLVYLGLFRLDVIEVNLSSMPKSFQDYRTMDMLTSRSEYFDPATKRLPSAPKQGVCLRLPTCLFGFEADREKFLRALQENLDPDRLGPEIAAKLTEKSDESFTSLWLADLKECKTLTTARVLPPESLLQNGRYRIKQILGHGGLSVVYDAEQFAGESHHATSGTSAQAQQRVAIKELVLNYGGTKGSRDNNLKQMLAEIELLRRLHHPNIVRFIEFFTESGKIYIVMERVGGQSLRDYVSQTGRMMSEEQLIGIAQQCCSVLSYLHSQATPILHRDFAPDNLIFSGDTIKLIDFNVAQKAIVDSSNTIVGKQCYMAPEQFCGEFTRQGDLYQLGCTLYFLATGVDPEPLVLPDPALLRPDLSDQFCMMIRKLTARLVDDRYSSAAEVAEELASSKQTETLDIHVNEKTSAPS